MDPHQAVLQVVGSSLSHQEIDSLLEAAGNDPNRAVEFYMMKMDQLEERVEQRLEQHLEQRLEPPTKKIKLSLSSDSSELSKGFRMRIDVAMSPKDFSLFINECRKNNAVSFKRFLSSLPPISYRLFFSI